MCDAARHNTISAYRRQGCRCPAAVAAIRAYWIGRRRGQPTATTRLSRDPFVDEVAVERALAGDPVTLTIRERIAAAKRGTKRGLSAAQIGELVGVTGRTVVRYRTGRVKSVA